MPVTSFQDMKRAVQQDLTIEQGTDLEIPITITDFDPTGYWAKLQVRPYKESNTVLFEMSTDNTKILTTGGVVTLVFAEADFIGATWRDGWYDLKLRSGTAPATKATRVMEGNFYIDLETTQ